MFLLEYSINSMNKKQNRYQYEYLIVIPLYLIARNNIILHEIIKL